MQFAHPPAEPAPSKASFELEKNERFRKTALAVHDIVSNRIYKNEFSSLEAYFRAKWRMSRAQVYRFMDAAYVYQVLSPLLSLSLTYFGL